MNQLAAIEYIDNNRLIGIKAGQERTTFLEIWMVVVSGRIFARSWGFAEKSWYNTFLSDPNGQLRCGERVFNMVAHIPSDMDELTAAINQAYLSKYNQEQNIEYAIGITSEAHIAKTMEFRIVD